MSENISILINEKLLARIQQIASENNESVEQAIARLIGCKDTANGKDGVKTPCDTDVKEQEV